MRRTKTILAGDILQELFARPDIAAKIAEGELPETWRAVVGDSVADMTTQLQLHRRILYVSVRSSVIRSELLYRREALRDELNRRSRVPIIDSVIIK
ncbi:MAG: DUF721 domain-containing protein [Alistipes sp.]|nr:DUF721 domain-containing protein [Alistipes sp.]